MSEFKLLSTEDYLKTLTDYTEEQKEEVRNFRGSMDYMSWEQFNFLFQQKIVERFAKLKRPRTMWVDNISGKIWYLNHYHKKFVICAKFVEEHE